MSAKWCHLSRYSTLNQMRFNAPKKIIHDGKMQTVVKLIIADCKFSLPEDFLNNKMAESHSKTLVCIISLM